MIDDNPNKHHNTFLFLKHTLYPTHGNYSHEEIRERLENQLSDVATHGTGETSPALAESGPERKDSLVTADWVVAT
jgi:hypothetical protein